MTLSGILPIDKPQGWTSHDVVARVRRLAGQKQVGHAGTLDPLATGLLLVVLGKATRLSAYLMDSPKTYCAEIVLGATTVTDDAEGPLASRAEIGHVTVEMVENDLRSLVGNIDQIPPAYAAVRHQGQKLYKLARQGVDVERTPRSVRIFDITLISWEPPRVRVLVRCGSGTYIRALARDLGQALGVGGYLHALRRMASGDFAVSAAQRLESLDSAALADALEPPDRAVLDWPAGVLSPVEADDVGHGRPVHLGGRVTGNVRLYDPSGVLLALAQCQDELAKPFLVLEAHGS